MASQLQRTQQQANKTGVHGGRAYYPHFKYNFITGSGHYTMGAARGLYGWSKAKELEQEQKVTEMLRRLSAEDLTESNAMGLGYGTTHHAYYRYLNPNNGHPRKGREITYPKLVCRASTPASCSSPAPAEPKAGCAEASKCSSKCPKSSNNIPGRRANMNKGLTGWPSDTDCDIEIEVNQLNMASSLGFGSTHPCRSLYLHRPYPPNLASWKPRPATALSSEYVPTCATSSMNNEKCNTQLPPTKY